MYRLYISFVSINVDIIILTGILSPKAGESPLQKDFDDFSTVKNEEVSKCFNTPNSVSLNIEDLLDIPRSGWTKIQEGIDDGKIEVKIELTVIFKLNSMSFV